jgi:hypothetical protein
MALIPEPVSFENVASIGEEDPRSRNLVTRLGGNVKNDDGKSIQFNQPVSHIVQGPPSKLQKNSRSSILVKNKIVEKPVQNGTGNGSSSQQIGIGSESQQFVKFEQARNPATNGKRKIPGSKVSPPIPEYEQVDSQDSKKHKLEVDGPEFSNKDSHLDPSHNKSPKRMIMQGKRALMIELQGAAPAETITAISELQRSQSIAMIDYFTDEVANIQNRNKINNKYFYYNSEVMFSVDQYLEFFMHHVVYFAFIGPLYLLAGLFSSRMYYLQYNIQLYKLNRYGMFQNLNFVLCMCVYYGFFIAEPNTYASLDASMLRTILLSLLLMTTSIAGKYATYPRILIKKFREIKISDVDFDREHMLGSWKTQTLEVRNIEINSAIERLEVDESIFFVAFMVEPSEPQIAKLQATYDDIIGEYDEHKALVTTHVRGRKMFHYYQGRYLFDMLLKEYKDIMQQRACGYNLYSVGVSLLWASANLSLRAILGEEHLLGSTWFDTTVFIVVSLATTMLFFMKFRFYLQAIIDLERRTYMMNQCGFLLSPMRIKDHVYDKVFPTINILDKTSLLSWFQMRRIAIDYGRKYFYRHELFLPISLMISIFAMVLIGIILYCHLKLGMFRQNSSEIYRLIYLLILDSAVFGFMSFHFMYSSGAINSQFTDHIILLKNNRAILTDLLNYKDYYFHKLLSEPAPASGGASFELELVKLGISDSQSYLHDKLKNEIANILGDRIDSDLTEYLMSLIKLYTDLVGKMRDEQEHYSIQILGVIVTKDSVLNLLIAVISVVLTAWQLFFGF